MPPAIQSRKESEALERIGIRRSSPGFPAFHQESFFRSGIPSFGNRS